MNTLAFVLSMASLLCMLTSSLIKGKNMKLILALVCAANFLVALSYFLQTPMAVNGGVSCMIGAAMSFINYFYDKDEKPVPKWLVAIYAVIITVLNAVVMKELYDLITIVAGLTFVLSIIQKSGKMFRVYTAVNMALWITYDLFAHSYGPILQHSIQFVFFIIGMLVHDRKKSE